MDQLVWTLSGKKNHNVHVSDDNVYQTPRSRVENGINPLSVTPVPLNWVTVGGKNMFVHPSPRFGSQYGMIQEIQYQNT